MNVVLLAAGGFLLYKLLGQATELSNKLTYSFTGLKWLRKQSSFAVTGLQTNMILKNPTNISATVTGVTGNVLINGKTLGSYYINNTFTIPANGTASVPTLITFSNTGVLAELKNILVSKKLPTVTLTGTISTTFGNVPFTYNIR